MSKQVHYLFRNIQDYYDHRYERGDEVHAKKKDIALSWLQQNFTDPGGIKVLDVGCGTGVYTRKIQEAGFNVIGADISPVAVQRLQRGG